MIVYDEQGGVYFNALFLVVLVGILCLIRVIFFLMENAQDKKERQEKRLKNHWNWIELTVKEVVNLKKEVKKLGKRG